MEKIFIFINAFLTIVLFVISIFQARFIHKLQLKVVGYLLFVTKLAFLGFTFLLDKIDISKNMGLQLLLYSLLVCMCYFFVFLPLMLLLKNKDIKNFCYLAKFEANEKSFIVKLFLDSGNFLYDKKTSLPIVLVSINKLVCKYNDKETNKLKNYYYNCKISMGEMTLFLFKPDFFYLKIGGKWKKKKVIIGLIEKKFADYDGLMGLKVIK